MSEPSLLELARVLPVPGPVWGSRPLRADDDRAPPWRRPCWRRAAGECRSVARSANAQAAAWAPLTAAQRGAALAALRMRLRRDGLTPAAMAEALGVASACAAETLGWTARPTQQMAAAALLGNRMVEMATGEGKTLAIGLAAAVAALAGVPVHVVTANSYLASRDAARLAPLFEALGLRAASFEGAQTDADRRAVYAHQIVYATAKDLAFDFLRDRQALAGRGDAECTALGLAGQAAPPTVMRGLCMALLDEADSILLDEAEVPLILSRAAPHAARRAFLWQALSLARTLEAGRDFTLQRAEHGVTLSAAGEQRLAARAVELGGPWLRARYRREAVQLALAGLHLFRRDEHYLVRQGAIELLDPVTGRIAFGRVWSRGLQTVVALKEGLRVPDETETVSQTTFQRFFQRYWRLAGISGTLWEARRELAAVYGAGVVRVPLHRPCRRLTLPPRRFEDAGAMFAALVDRVAVLQAARRPVLVGTDSVADSQQLSDLLQRSGIGHRVLNALHHADEAAIVAQAGRAGQVTVATRMAGRGTDIELDAAARAAGGLHVISCQRNPSRRLDRQLAGRAGRQGEAGSTEAWYLARFSTPVDIGRADNLSPWKLSSPLDTWLQCTPAGRRWTQWREERRRAAQRSELLRQDLEWERRLSFAGPLR